MFKESISNEELTEMPLKWFEGEIVLVDSPKKLQMAVEELSSQSIIGFDTETKPSFKKGVINKVALLQLSTKNRAFLLRTNRIGLPREIVRILADENVIKPGVAIRDDIKGLQEIRKFKPGGFVELQDEAKEMGIQNFSLKKLTAIACGFRISKGQQLTNWEADILSEAQQRYAATDAWASLEIFESFQRISYDV
ncbi:3'-5' exonuclease domain-containing protein 2 [Prolixibacteraceae bacterium Z1-6]|uniref:3'-5' exonuclease domain-containing protein 2 n=1 Tax=Draconibacterium aestuarii TaxID=2998507 RepID=A0A9X3F3I4_9BACT|nr:3'-5' exonuclease domain-containing protein 2 [Prolixibacteraceae bacterium Z1-6]